MKIAFYAPLKAPEDPTPSGDRTMARLLVKALKQAGHEVELASHLRSFSAAADAARLAELESIAGREVDTVRSRWSQPAEHPDLFLTYHPYYKAPDLIGPAVASALAMPYVTIEASHAPKRNAGPWRSWQRHVEQALDMAALNICMTARDRVGLAAYLGSGQRLATLPPFIEVREAEPANRTTTLTELVTVAMMRPGDKLRSYDFLARALEQLPGDWCLTIIGDGPMRAEVERLFARPPEGRVVFLGALAAEAVHNRLACADLYLWPGFGEAYGLAYLEAQAQGLPVVALDTAGVSSVVEHGRTGLLVAPTGLAADDSAAYRSAIMSLIDDAPLRLSMSRAARHFAREERNLPIAAARLNALLHRITS